MTANPVADSPLMDMLKRRVSVVLVEVCPEGKLENALAKVSALTEEFLLTKILGRSAEITLDDLLPKTMENDLFFETNMMFVGKILKFIIPMHGMDVTIIYERPIGSSKNDFARTYELTYVAEAIPQLGGVVRHKKERYQVVGVEWDPDESTYKVTARLINGHIVR